MTSVSFHLISGELRTQLLIRFEAENFVGSFASKVPISVSQLSGFGQFIFEIYS